MNFENNNNLNSTEDSLFSDITQSINDYDSEYEDSSEYSDSITDYSDMPELINDSENESDLESETDYSDMPELINDSENESDLESKTDYSDMPELISIEQLELINNLRKPFINDQNLQISSNESLIYNVDNDNDNEID